MKKLTKNEEISRLAKALREAEKSYYNSDANTMTDEEYDRKKIRLAKLDPYHPVLTAVGAYPDKKDIVRDGAHKMGSLTNIETPEDLIKWVKKYSDGELLITTKVDGLSVELQYSNHELVGAYTRGDGVTGQDVTGIVSIIRTVPRYIQHDGDWNIRGEVYIPNGLFPLLNDKRRKAGMEPYKLPRAAATGLLLSGNVSGARKTELSFVAWELHGGNFDIAGRNERDNLRFIKRELAIPTVPRIYLADLGTFTEKEAGERLREWNTWRKEYEFATDGVVISINSRKRLKALGWNSHCPKGKVAYKFPTPGAKTIVTSITVQVGRTGKLTPVAWFDAVNIDGSRVKKATMHNFSEMTRMGVSPGATVLVKKGGEIIPKIVEVLEKGKTPWVQPSVCPVCFHKVAQRDKVTFCVNELCKSRMPMRILHWCKVLDVLGVGEVAAIALARHMDALPDLYKCPNSVLRGVFGAANALKIRHQLDAHRKADSIPLERFLEALGYKYIGKSHAAKLASAFVTTNALRHALAGGIHLVAEKVRAAGFTTDTAKRHINGSLYENRKEITDMIDCIGVKDYTITTKKGALTGKVICMTGTLTLSRKLMAGIITTYGGVVVDDVTRECNMLLVGTGGGGKLDKANRRGIQIITEEQFRDCIERKDG